MNRLKAKLRDVLPESKLLSLVTKLLDNKTYKILHNGEESQSLKLNNGIPQGDSMSPTVFCLYMNDFLSLRQNVEDIDPASIDDLRISSVIYADDILLQY